MSAFTQSLRSQRGQFIPITSLVVLTTVVFMVAAVNVYQVTRTKLKAQNMADAIATNLAAEQAQAFNSVIDRNELLNHMVAGVPSLSDLAANGGSATCPPDDPRIVPGISCVENLYSGGDDQHAAMRMGGHIFHSKDGAKNYAALVKIINDTQRLFLSAYDNFLGANTGSSSQSGAASLQDTLRADFGTELDKYQIYVANTKSGDDAIQGQANSAAQSRNSITPGQILPNMTPLSNQFQIHDIHTVWFKERCLGSLPFCVHNSAVDESTFGTLVDYADGVGWMEPKQPMQTLDVGQNTANAKSRVGISVIVMRSIQVPLLGSIPIVARSKAYLVEGSGISGAPAGSPSNTPIFKPTYWVKLAT